MLFGGSWTPPETSRLDAVRLIHRRGVAMVRQPGFFDVEERLRELLAKGDDL